MFCCTRPKDTPEGEEAATEENPTVQFQADLPTIKAGEQGKGELQDFLQIWRLQCSSLIMMYCTGCIMLTRI